MAVVKRDKRSMSASSEESGESWSHITPEDDPHEETSSFIQLSEGSVTVAAPTLTPPLPPLSHRATIAADTNRQLDFLSLQHSRPRFHFTGRGRACDPRPGGAVV